MRYRGVPCLLICLFLFIGCQSPQRDAGFSDTQRLVAARIPSQIIWNQNSTDARTIESAISELLTHDLSIDDATQIALLNNHNLQATYARLGIAQADLVQAGLLKNPVFDASVRFPDHSPKGPNVELSITQEFIDLLMIPLRQKIASAQLEQAKLQVAQSVVEMSNDVRAAYFTLCADQQMLDLRKTNAEALRLSSETAQRLAEAGNLNDLKLANQQALYEEARADLDAAIADVQSDREMLAALMGLDSGEQPFAIAPPLPDPPGDLPVDQLEALAHRQRLDIVALAKGIDVLQATSRATRTAAFIPGLSLGADTEREPDGARVTGPTFSIPIPLFDQGQAALSRSQFELLQAREQYQALCVQMQSDVRRTASKVAALRARVRRYRDSILPLRNQIVAQSQLHYNGMLLDVLQLLQAKRDEVNAQHDYTIALRDYWIARVDLERAVGGRLPQDMPTTMPSTVPTTVPASPPTESHEHHHHGE